MLVQRHQFERCTVIRRFDVTDLVLRMQFAPVSQLTNAARIIPEPLPGWQRAQVLVLEMLGWRFEPCLFGVAPIDKQHRRVWRHKQSTRRTGKAGGPQQALELRRCVFIEVLVIVRH